MKKLIMIAAVGKNNELGYNEKLIWHLKEDMKFFRDQTINHHVLMGKTTFFSLPDLLENREHIILSKKNDIYIKEVSVVNSIEEFFEKSKYIDDDIYVIGGASVYKSFIDKVDEIYLTKIDDTKEADVFFPLFDEKLFRKRNIKEGCEDGINYKIIRYRRKKG